MNQTISFFISLLFVLAVNNLSAQEDYVTTTQEKKIKKELPVCPRFFMGPSIGMNNNGGIFSNDFEFGVEQHVSLAAGFGLGMWGPKGYVEGKYYFKECYKGWAAGIGVTRSGGSHITIEDIGATTPQDVTLRLLPQTNISLQGYRYFKIGKRHRMHISGGYSVKTSDEKYRVVGPNMPSRSLRNYIYFIAPGGVIIGFGMTFGL